MSHKTNKEIIQQLYEVALNERKFELLSDLISEEFVGIQNKKGPAAFEIPIINLIKAFPDMQWHIDDLIEEDELVAVRWHWNGIHTAPFQNLSATNKTIDNDGFAMYTIKDTKITHVAMLTDRLGFLQQLGVLPADITTLYSAEQIRFIDKFFIPAEAITQFTERMNYNRSFIKTLPGFIQDEIYQQTDENGNMTIITIATWQNEKSIKEAKELVQAEYKRIGFDLADFMKRLNIKVERDLYQKIN